MGGISRPYVLFLAALALSSCRRPNPNDVVTMTGGCSTHVRAKGRAPLLPRSPSLRSGFGAVVGTLADSGGALPHYAILASTPGDAPNSPHASATADSVGGFVFDALPPGRYRLLVRAYAHRPDSAEIEIAAGRVDTVRLSPLFFQCVR
ncbi:MAG TPA: carboxypeptidase-like regulatory domain-containing protein [Gemmatimonadaceae bacterium]|nr:carboxypeptidase-like regulatory domain-containing protein [Gemmatimonadaceae bacterium]